MHCLSVLAFVPADRALPAWRLAELYRLPAAYLTKHLQALVRAGIIVSVSGPKGGFRLNRSAEAITLLDVVQAVEGNEPAFRCTEIRQQGPTAVERTCYRRPCGIAAAFARAEAAWREALESITLAQLIRDLNRTVDPRQLRRGAEWLERALAP